MINENNNSKNLNAWSKNDKALSNNQILFINYDYIVFIWFKNNDNFFIKIIALFYIKIIALFWILIVYIMAIKNNF